MPVMRGIAFGLVALALTACGGSPPDGTARPPEVQQQLLTEVRAATNCREAQEVFDRFLAASQATKKGTDRSKQQIELTDVAYKRGTELGCPAFP